MTNAVLFGIGTIIVLSIPPLAENARYLLPAIVASSFLLAPFIAWRLTSRLRPQVWPRRQSQPNFDRSIG
jgi:hypothetical protein